MSKSDPDSSEPILPDSMTEAKLTAKFREKLLEVVSYRLPGKAKEDHEDLAADSIAAAFKNIKEGKFDSQKATLETYVFRIAFNKIADFIEHEKKHNPINQDPEKAPEPYFTEDDPLEKEEERAHLRTVLKQLPTKYQEVLYLKYYEELPVREISDVIGLPPRRVSERIHYALKLLVKRYKNEK